MSNNITKTIQESLEKRHCSCIYECNCESHLLQSQIRLLEAVIESLKNGFVQIPEGQSIETKECKEFYNAALQDQISSLNETLEELKKEYVAEYQKSVNDFLGHIRPMIDEFEKMEKNQCKHPGEGAYACYKCGEKLY